MESKQRLLEPQLVQTGRADQFSRKVFCDGMRDGVPIALGYFAVSFSLGIAARKAGFTPFQGFLVSLLNNASAGEYAAFALIMANATPALQAAQAATNTIPILGTSVTEYGVALGIDDFDGLVGTNISGTSDLAPLDEQAGIIKELFPDAKTVGLLYCSAEANSQYQVDTVKASLEELGYTCEYYAFSDSNDLATITTNAATNSDVIYVPTDNTVAANTEIVNNICQPAKVPVIAGEEGICSGCGVATLSISYYDLGVATGKMAVKILTGEANVSEMPIEYAPQFTKKYNKTICDALEITVPDDYVAIEE